MDIELRLKYRGNFEFYAIIYNFIGKLINNVPIKIMYSMRFSLTCIVPHIRLKVIAPNKCENSCAFSEKIVFFARNFFLIIIII